MNDAPGNTGSCVTSVVPSMAFGVWRPWKWIDVDMGNSLWSTIEILSPSFASSVGPGTVPL